MDIEFGWEKIHIRCIYFVFLSAFKKVIKNIFYALVF